MQVVEIINEKIFVGLEKKIKEGYKIISVCPLSYDAYSNGHFLRNAVVVLEKEDE